MPLKKIKHGLKIMPLNKKFAPQIEDLDFSSEKLPHTEKLHPKNEICPLKFWVFPQKFVKNAP